MIIPICGVVPRKKKKTNRFNYYSCGSKKPGGCGINDRYYYYACAVIPEPPPIIEPIVVVPPAPVIKKDDNYIPDPNQETVLAGIIPYTTEDVLLGSDGKKYFKNIYTVSDFNLNIQPLNTDGLETEAVYFRNPYKYNSQYPFIKKSKTYSYDSKTPDEFSGIFDLDSPKLTNTNTLQNQFKNNERYFTAELNESAIKGTEVSDKYLLNQQIQTQYQTLLNLISSSKYTLQLKNNSLDTNLFTENYNYITGRTALINLSGKNISETFKDTQPIELIEPEDFYYSCIFERKLYKNQNEINKNTSIKVSDDRELLHRLADYSKYPLNQEYKKEESEKLANFIIEGNKTTNPNVNLYFKKKQLRQHQQEYFIRPEEIIGKFTELFSGYINSSAEYYLQYFKTESTKFKYYKNKISNNIKAEELKINNNTSEKNVMTNQITNTTSFNEILNNLLIPANDNTKLEVLCG